MLLLTKYEVMVWFAFTIKELNDAVAIVSKKGFSRELTIEFQRVIFDFDLF